MKPVPTAQRSAWIRELLARQPRIPLAALPTPLQEAERLSAELGIRLLIKREDLTGLAFGGNKTRNYEFRLADPALKSADTLIMSLEITSNSARQIVAACNRLGMNTVLVLKGRQPQPVQGNLLVDYLLGAEIHYADSDEQQSALIEEIFERLTRERRTPVVLTSQPSFDVGSALAYIECTLEIVEQAAALGAEPDTLYMTSGGKGQAGLELGKRLLDSEMNIHGVTVSYEYDVAPRTARIAADTAAVLGVDVAVDPGEVISFDDFVGPGYGHITEEALAAMVFAGQRGGILLDPIYTGKCFAALLEHVRTGLLEQGSTVVFIHTGGTPAIFDHATAILDHLGIRPPERGIEP